MSSQAKVLMINKYLLIQMIYRINTFKIKQKISSQRLIQAQDINKYNQ